MKNFIKDYMQLVRSLVRSRKIILIILGSAVMVLLLNVEPVGLVLSSKHFLIMSRAAALIILLMTGELASLLIFFIFLLPAFGSIVNLFIRWFQLKLDIPADRELGELVELRAERLLNQVFLYAVLIYLYLTHKLSPSSGYFWVLFSYPLLIVPLARKIALLRILRAKK